MILIPVKNLAFAKQRLAEVLEQSERTELAQAMLLDVLDGLQQLRPSHEIALVSSDAFAVDQAAARGYEVIADNANRSETDAIEMATRYCVTRGRGETLVIPADIPLIQAAAVRAIFDSAPAQGTVLVTAADARGTNAVLRRPADLFPLRFGNDSFKPHLAAAQAAQKPCVVLDLPGIALDIDNPSELRQLASLPGVTRAQRLARQWGFASLPVAANE